MTKKQGGSGQKKPAQPQQAHKKAATPAGKSGSSKTLWMVGGAIVVVIVAVLALSNVGGKGGTAGADPAEAKYMGRLLPKGYQEPKVASVVTYDSEKAMTPVTAADSGSALTLSADDVVNAKIVSFSYTRPGGGKPIPLLAYVKPSGKLFVGVSFCPPCEGEQQFLEPDISLKCASCGTKRNAETGVGISGACKLYPIDEVPATVANGKITIEKSTLDNWTPQPKDRKIG